MSNDRIPDSVPLPAEGPDQIEGKILCSICGENPPMFEGDDICEQCLSGEFLLGIGI